MTATASWRPARPFTPGRYLLCTAGRLYPLDAIDLIDTAAIVTVRAKSTPSPDQIRAECAIEASERESRFRKAKRLTTAHPLKPIASERDKPTRPLARRREKPRPAPELDADDETFAEFTEKLAAAKARREAGVIVVRKAKPAKHTGAEIADALARRPTKAPTAPKKAPTQRALGPGECYRCGIPGFRGCDHFLPFVGS